MQRRSAAIGLASLLCAPLVQAQGTLYCGPTACPTLPAPVGAVHVSNLDTTAVAPPGAVITGAFGAGSIVYDPSPTLMSSSAVSRAEQRDSNIAHTELTYFFRIASLAPVLAPTAVPLLISGSYDLSVAASGRGLGEATVTLGTNLSGFETLFVDLLSSDASCAGANCARSDDYALKGVGFTGVTMSLTMHAYAYGQSDRADPASAGGGIAVLDPVIGIDPGFADAGRYSIVVSPQVGNLPAVPEPTSTWLAWAGLAMLGLHLRRRKALPAG